MTCLHAAGVKAVPLDAATRFLAIPACIDEAAMSRFIAAALSAGCMRSNNLLSCLSVTNSDVAKNSNQSLAVVADREF